MTKSEGFEPLNDLCSFLSARFARAFVNLGLPENEAIIVPSERPELGAFQCNAAMKLAKKMGQNPKELAQKIIDDLKYNNAFFELSMAGPGFINIDISNHIFELQKIKAVSGGPQNPRVISRRKVIIDYGGPNVAKPMHVGHLRTAVIGECLKRLFRHLGDEVMGDAHFGDWGYQMGLLITALSDEKPELPYFSSEDLSPYPEQSPVSLSDLERLYPLASGRAKADTDYRDRARRATKSLQDGHVGYKALWRHFVAVSREALIKDYGDLGVSFDWWYGESDADPYIEPMIHDLKERGFLEADQGALIVRVAKDDDKRELPPLLVVSSEGSSMYGTTDLATIRQRVDQFSPDLILYCVDQRQADHFEQVFRAADRSGYIGKSKLEHIANGTVNGPDGKPFKTREGGVLKLGDLIDQARQKAKERLDEAKLGSNLSETEFQSITNNVAIAAIKFAELSNHRLTNYIFDLDRFMSFEGRTGPYLIYQAVRIKSIMRKAKEIGAEEAYPSLNEEAEIDLYLILDRWPAVLKETYLKRAPNILADHIYRLAQGFSKFYASCPILNQDDEKIRSERLGLLRLVLAQLEDGFALMGIEAPDRM
jgi:arginyl-tRNA synthetase